MIDYREIDVECITPSPTNPRKRFNEKELQDLAESIKAKGVMQPILVRPLNAAAVEAGQEAFFRYEIVAGERRWRATKLAGIESMPATVRELDDIETLQLQIIENMQRSDLHPLEEAEALQNMLKATGANGQRQWTHEELGAKIGKSRTYVFASLNLLKLSNFAKDKFLEDKFGRETALLISRIPGEKLQERLVKDITERELSYRAAKDYIHRDFTYQLDKASWDKFDNTLLADTPSCAKCPKRSGNFPELFPDIESPDVCTDPTCFKNKKDAYADRVIKTMPRVIHGDQAKEVAPYGYNTYITNGYVRSLDTVTVDGFNAAEVLGEDAPEPFTLVDETKNIGKVYKKDEVETLLREKLQEKLASGELQPKQTKKDEPSPWQVLHEKKRKRAEEITAVLMPHFQNQMTNLRDLLVKDDLKTKEAIYAQFDEQVLDNTYRDLFFDAFGHSHINEFNSAELLISAVLIGWAHQFEIASYEISDDLTFDYDKSDVPEAYAFLEKLTGIPLPPLPAAQAQELNPESEPATQPPAADASAPVETSEPAPTPSPAPLEGDEKPKSNFDRIREQEEARRARRAKRDSKKESAQADD